MSCHEENPTTTTEDSPLVKTPSENDDQHKHHHNHHHHHHNHIPNPASKHTTASSPSYQNSIPMETMHAHHSEPTATTTENASKQAKFFSILATACGTISLAALAAALAVLVVALEIFYSTGGKPTPINFQPISISTVENATISAALATARSKLMSARPSMTRLDATLLLPKPMSMSSASKSSSMMNMNMPQEWMRGDYNSLELAYPASCVKLAYLFSSVHWCLSQSPAAPPNCLDQAQHPMITVSSNLHTGVIVDVITGATNQNFTSSTDPNFQSWVAKRSYTANLLAQNGLLGNQTVLSKTYPTNSGVGPVLAEELVIQTYGSNRMNPNNTAALMLLLVKGNLVPEGNDYITTLLRHERTEGYSSFGHGLPPGTRVLVKIGDAYNDLNDISFITLPNGQEFVLSAFSDALEFGPNENLDLSNLGMFAEYVIEELNLCDGCPPMIKMDDTQIASSTGQWTTSSNAVDSFNGTFLYTYCNNSATTATWQINAPEDGLYEVSVWYTEGNDRGTAVYTVNSNAGPQGNSVNQQYYGGRWIGIGSYYFYKGTGSVQVAPSSECESCDGPDQQIIVADAIKVTMWPDSHSVNGIANVFYPSSS